MGVCRDAVTILSGWKVDNGREEAQGAGPLGKCPGRTCAFQEAGQRGHTWRRRKEFGKGLVRGSCAQEGGSCSGQVGQMWAGQPGHPEVSALTCQP